MRGIFIAFVLVFVVNNSASSELIRNTLGSGTFFDGAVMLDRSDDEWGSPGLVIEDAPFGVLGEWRFRVAGFTLGDTVLPFTDPAQFEPFDWSLWIGSTTQYLANARGLPTGAGSVFDQSDGLNVEVIGSFPDFFLVTDLEPLAIPAGGDFLLALKALSTNSVHGTVVLAAYDGPILQPEDFFAGNFVEFGDSFSPGRIVTDHEFEFSQFAVSGEILVPEPSSVALLAIGILLLAIARRYGLGGKLRGS